MKLSQKAKHAILIGTLCSVSYFAIYNARNILSAVTPQMTAQGYGEAYIGAVSSLYFIFYAVGQLINGAIGDHIKAKWMIAIGLLGAGVSNLVFSQVAANQTAAMAAYAMTGLFLSMIYGPMTKVVSENTKPIHATRCSLGYTCASFLGSPSAGLLASLLAWQSVFAVSSGLLVTMAILSFAFFSLFERRGIVRYGQYRPEKKGIGGVKVLLKNQIVKFSFVALITGIVRTSVVFWMPQYFKDYLGYSETDAALIFTATTFVITFTTFIAIFVYERLGYNMDRTMLLMFSLSLVFFVLLFAVKHPIVNIGLFVLAVMASNAAATMLYSRYCPSLRDTGMVSSATGFLDFLSYMSAAGANLVFPLLKESLGWQNLILVWIAIIACGVITVLPYKKIFQK